MADVKQTLTVEFVHNALGFRSRSGAPPRVQDLAARPPSKDPSIFAIKLPSCEDLSSRYADCSTTVSSHAIAGRLGSDVNPESASSVLVGRCFPYPR